MIVNAVLLLALSALSSVMVSAQRTCSSLSVPPCARQVDRDLLFLVDASDSMDPARFQREMLDYTQSLYCAFPGNNNKAGLITFASKIEVRVPLDRYTAPQWFAKVEEVRGQNLCCSCCTPTATAFSVARSVFEAVPIGNAYRIVFTITDGAPWQNEKSTPTSAGQPFLWPDIPSATYTWSVVPQQANLIKKMIPDDETRYRIMMVGVPNKNLQAPRDDYFKGIPNPAMRPSGKAASWQCQSRGGKTTCFQMLNPPFPIVSTPINKNIFQSNEWNVQNLINLTADSVCEILPTPAPTKQPTTMAPTSLAPTKQPTSSAPTKQPTTPGPTSKAPTPAPTTLVPTNPPTKAPTFRPTSSPSRTPSQAPVKPFLDGLDMFYILDRSRSMRWVPDLCRNAPGGNRQDGDTVACWRLFLRFVGQITQKIVDLPYRQTSQKMGWKDAAPSDLKRGLRVWIYGFACQDHQSSPLVFNIGEKIGSQAGFEAAMDSANAMVPFGGTCPGAAIERAVAMIQGNDLLTRIYKSAILFTDGVFYDMPRPRLATRGMFHFGVLTYAMGIAIPSEGEDWGLKPGEILRQSAQLKNFVGGNEDRLFNFGAEGLQLLDEIAQALVDQLPADAIANLPKVAKNPYFCGWTSIARCTETNPDNTNTGKYCFWNKDMKACLNKTWCKWGNRAKCAADKNCLWAAGKCSAKPVSG